MAGLSSRASPAAFESSLRSPMSREMTTSGTACKRPLKLAMNPIRLIGVAIGVQTRRRFGDVNAFL